MGSSSGICVETVHGTGRTAPAPLMGPKRQFHSPARVTSRRVTSEDMRRPICPKSATQHQKAPDLCNPQLCYA
jgi:hypothetical protein